MYLKESCFLDCSKVSIEASFLRMFKRKRDLLLKTTTLVSVVCKIFVKLVNDKPVDYLNKCDLFSDF